MPYRIVWIKGGLRQARQVDYAHEATEIGDRMEAEGCDVFVAYPNDPIENTLAWFKASIQATGGSTNA